MYKTVESGIRPAFYLKGKNRGHVTQELIKIDEFLLQFFSDIRYYLFDASKQYLYDFNKEK